LPDGKILQTLEDARLYILALSTSEQRTTAWEVAIEALLVAAETKSVTPTRLDLAPPLA
jgi:hypothetical protein